MEELNKYIRICDYNKEYTVSKDTCFMFMRNGVFKHLNHTRNNTKLHSMMGMMHFFTDDGKPMIVRVNSIKKLYKSDNDIVIFADNVKVLVRYNRVVYTVSEGKFVKYVEPYSVITSEYGYAVTHAGRTISNVSNYHKALMTTNASNDKVAILKHGTKISGIAAILHTYMKIPDIALYTDDEHVASAAQAIGLDISISEDTFIYKITEPKQDTMFIIERSEACDVTINAKYKLAAVEAYNKHSYGSSALSDAQTTESFLNNLETFTQ